MDKYAMTAYMAARTHLNAGIFYLLPRYLLRALHLVPLLFLWQALMQSGVKADMQLSQMLTYTYMAALLAPMLNIQTPLTGWLYEGQVLSCYLRPMGVLRHVAAQTFGEMLPSLMLFTLPMLFLGPVLGISVLPHSAWFALSLMLCAALGLAIDFLFACLMLHMMNGRWLLYNLRSCTTWLLSGTLIPFALLPWGLGDVLSLTPFASMGGAVLALYVGISSPLSVIALQLFWNALLWPLAIFAFKKSSQRMVSHGG